MSLADEADGGYLNGHLRKQEVDLKIKIKPLRRASARVVELNKSFLCKDFFSPKMTACFDMILEIWSSRSRYWGITYTAEIKEGLLGNAAAFLQHQSDTGIPVSYLTLYLQNRENFNNAAGAAARLVRQNKVERLLKPSTEAMSI